MRKVVSVALALAMTVFIAGAQEKGKGGGGKGKGGFTLPPVIKITVAGATDTGPFPAANVGAGGSRRSVGRRFRRARYRSRCCSTIPIRCCKRTLRRT